MKYISLLVFVSSLVFSPSEASDFLVETDIPELAYINETVDPCEDFYEFTCGNFKNIHEIPSNTLNVDQFSILQENLTQLANEILASGDSSEDPVALKKARAAYKACVDVELANSLFLSNPELELVEKQGGFPLVMEQKSAESFTWNDIGDLMAEYGVPLMFSISPYYDLQNSSNMMVFISKDPIGIPQEINQKSLSYEDAIETGLYDLAVNSDKISTYSNESSILPMDKLLRFLSLKIKKATGSSVANEDIYEKLDNVTNFMKGIYYGGVVPDIHIDAFPSSTVTLNELNAWTQKYFQDVELDWIEYLGRVFKNSGVEITGDTEVLSSSGLNLILYGVINWVKMNDVSTVKSMAMLRIFLYMSPDGDAETRHAFDTYLKAIQKPTYPRWEYCTRKITDATGTVSLSFALTYEYQLRYFNVNKLSKAAQMVLDIQQSFREIINESEWMDDSSKSAALQKVDNVVTLLGYPDFVANKTALDTFYENVRICKWDNYGNSKRIRAFQQAYQLNQYRIRDRTAWVNSPFDVNAYYNRPNNRIIFPLAMLNPVFFGANTSVLDYSRIGSIIGHEITHGFDNNGRLYDQDGNIANWWSNSTLTEFLNRTSCFVQQYSKYYIPEIQTYVNGSTTLNENIADNGGTRNSYRALQKLLQRFIRNQEIIPRTEKYNVNQLFFIGFGTMWCNNESPSYLASSQKCTSNCHARSKWRVNGVLSNMEEFSNAFNCPTGSAMNPEPKCRLW